MARYTFEQLMEMDIYQRNIAVKSMSVAERKSIECPQQDPEVNKYLQEEADNTPISTRAHR